MPKLFGKEYNANVYTRYVDRDDIVRNDPKSEILTSGAVTTCKGAADALANAGLAHVSVPFYGTAFSDYQLNDGQTDITAEEQGTYTCGKAVFTPMKGWTERDFANYIGSANFFERMAVDCRHWENNMKVMCAMAIVKGIFMMATTGGTDAQNAANKLFLETHTYDISKDATNNKVAVDTIGAATVQACGENADKFELVFMHSVVAQNLKSKKLLEYLKYTDANGIERMTNIATWDGKTVFVSDFMPKRYVPALGTAVTAVQGVHTITIAGTPALGDYFIINGKKYNIVNTAHTDNEIALGTGTATVIATALQAKLEADPEFSSMYTVTRTAGVITVTEITGGCGYISATANGGSTITVACTTTPVKGQAAYSAHTEYTTFVIGTGMLQLENLQVANKRYVPDYKPEKNGGTSYLYGHMRNMFGADGISFKDGSKTTYDISDIAKSGAWEIPVSSNGIPLNTKKIPIVRIISQG